MRTRLLQAGAVASFALVLVLVSFTQSKRTESIEEEIGAEEVTPLIARKMAAYAKFAPGGAREAGEDHGGAAEQDWLEHDTDGQGNAATPLSAITAARTAWGFMRARGNGGGAWVPYGPTNGANDLNNPYRDRSVYNAGTENFSGRTVHAVISPDCAAADCALWIANANGGVWHTENALAVDSPGTVDYEGPAWEFLSGSFDRTTSHRSSSIPTIRITRRSGPARASRTRAAAAARPASASTCRATAATSGKDRSARTSSPAAPSARSK